jgi:hypothetical protein
VSGPFLFRVGIEAAGIVLGYALFGRLLGLRAERALANQPPSHYD